MRIALLLALSLSLGACSCSRKPDPDAIHREARPQPPAAAPQAVDAAELKARQARTEALQAQRSAMSEAGDLMQRYLGALATGDTAAADGLWVGGKPPPVPDDAALRALGPRSMRINTDAPVPLDPDHVPSQSFEVPVRLRVADRDGGVQQWRGWYRVRRAADASHWEITTASLHPQLD